MIGLMWIYWHETLIKHILYIFLTKNGDAMDMHIDYGNNQIAKSTLAGHGGQMV
jgi:hypothetical protein